MLFFLILNYITSCEQILNLDSNWKFRSTTNKIWYSANVPSTVHLDLLDHNLIKDPYLEQNLLEMYEWELHDWEYQTIFSFSEIPKFQQYELVFEGLDTYADVYLNDQLILQANNMHRTWRVFIQNLQLQNVLLIYFHSAAIRDLEQQMIDAPLNLPYNYSYSRKAAYQYGWDWGPRLVTCGIWKPVYLQMYDFGRIDAFYLKTLSIQEKAIEVEVVADLYILKPAHISLVIQVNKYTYGSELDNLYPYNQFTHKFLLNLTNVQPWWPIKQGDQNVYLCTLQLQQNTKVWAKKSITTGFRIVKWIQEKDKFNGSTFKMNFNGQDIYLKGANYIPPDMFMPRAARNPKVYDKIFEDSIAAGYNGLRLWGGGQFELDYFYQLADKYGIVIWHDLMFACAMYPGNQEFLDNVQEELRDNVRRLRIHPSIVMWNGNNEVGIGWREWGWNSNRNQQEIDQLQYWYDQLFGVAIPEILEEVNPEVFYWPTSPSSSSSTTNTEELSTGDIHYWSVWAAAAPIENYKIYIGRFNSEYGMQAMIDVSNFRKVISNEFDLQLNSPTLQLHERHVIGIELIQKYLANYTKPYDDIYQLTYNTQVIQYHALSTAIQSLRSQKPFNWGTFYWQINDVWPVISWATVDYYGCWKGGHYAAKQYHKDPILTVFEQEGFFKVYLVNDQNRQLTGSVSIYLYGYNGYEYRQWNFYNTAVNNQQSELLLTYLIDDYEQLKSKTYLLLKFTCHYVNCDYTGTYNFGTPKEYQLLSPKIYYTIKGNVYTFNSQYYAKWVYIYNEQECLNITNNYFDIIPGIPVSIQITKKFKFMSFYDIGQKQSIQ